MTYIDHTIFYCICTCLVGYGIDLLGIRMLLLILCMWRDGLNNSLGTLRAQNLFGPG
ncbi:hypothetical protein BDZ91DRAFT_720710 [Kalaharituber pfeilii]|nr:hypothetical protein BDZ91DRAFT_720710 [Kalaharituber pfeilii]